MPATNKKAEVVDLTHGCHWPEMNRVNALSQKLADTLGRLIGLSRGGAQAAPGDYAGHIAHTVRGYRRGILRTSSELLEAISAAGATLPREVTDDGAGADTEQPG